MKVYGFDVDETLEISNGPVPIRAMIDLLAQGHGVGLCGNWGAFFSKVPDWHRHINFFNAFIDKREFMKMLRECAGPYLGAEEFVMVGNILHERNRLGFVCGSDDKTAAEYAGWRFIKEDDFANGVR